MRVRLVEPSTEQILAYCAEDPVERVFLEDVARRGHGRFAGLERDDGSMHALCHLGTNVVPSGPEAVRSLTCSAPSPRMLIGEEAAVTDLWEAGRERFGGCGRIGRRSRLRVERGARAGRHGAPPRDPRRPRHARARVRGRTTRRSASTRWRDRTASAGARARRSTGPLVGLARGRRDPVQGRGIGVDRGRAAPAGVGRSARTRNGNASRALRDLIGRCSRASRRSASSSARRTRPRSGSTRPSACGTRSRTGVLFSGLLLARHAHARSECGRPDQLPCRPARVWSRLRRRGGARASRGGLWRTGRSTSSEARGRDEAPSHAGRSTLELARSTTPWCVERLVVRASARSASAAHRAVRLLLPDVGLVE